MKKVISLLAAFAILLTLNVAAFAADDVPGTGSSLNTAATNDNTTGTRAANDQVLVVDDNNTGITNDYGTTANERLYLGADNTFVIGANELLLVDLATKRVVGGYDHLIPDKEYTFRVYHSTAGTTYTIGEDVDTFATPLTGDMLAGGTVRLRTKKGSSYISGARVKTTGRGASSVYDIVLTTRAQYGTTMSDVEYILSATGIGTGTATTGVTPVEILESQHSFEVGWPSIDEDQTQVGEDGIIVLSNDAPVITKDQFADISRSANYRNVNFEGEDAGWKFVGRTSGMASSNFYFTYDVVPEIINRFPEQDYKFLNFRGGVTFPANGEMRIDVSDMANEFNAIHTYLYRNGALTPVATTFDSDMREIVFRTNHLGTFVMTDVEITDVNIIAEPNEPIDREPEPEPDETDHRNPATGASTAMDLGIALGLATLVTAGTISRKRK